MHKRPKEQKATLTRITLSGVCCNIFVPPNRMWFLSLLADNVSSMALPEIETCIKQITFL